MLDTGDGGVKRPTIKDVAARAGVSFKTVSRVMNGQASVNPNIRAAVERAMAELDYRPHRAARAMRSSRSFAMAVLTGGRDEPADGGSAHFPAFMGDVVMGAAQGCRAAGYHLVLEYVAYGDQRRATAIASALIDDVAPDGVILLPPLCDQPWLLDLLETRGVPHVRLLPGAQPDRGLSMAINDLAAARAMTQHLLDLGHRHIGFIDGPPDHLAASARRTGFAVAMAGCDGAVASHDAGTFFMASGEAAATRLLSLPRRPTAIFAANDSMAAGAIRAAHSLGLRVPGDVSIAGFDDSALAQLTLPALTTMRQPVRDMARRAVGMLVAGSGGQSGDARADPSGQFTCDIVLRGSTAHPPHHA